MQPFAVPFADVRWLPARGSIDRSLEDKPLGGRKKIVITATIAVDKGNREKERERERERGGEEETDIKGSGWRAARPTERILLSR